MRRSANPIALLAALLLGACGSATTSSGTGAGGGPAPEPMDPSDPPPAEEGRGPAVTYRPVSGAAYRLEHRDSLVFQYQGGASQTQTRDRVALVHLTIAEAPARGSYQVTVTLDSLEALESGNPVPPV